jgi:predicted HAD superfamily Cof-like phosphohydrolase
MGQRKTKIIIMGNLSDKYTEEEWDELCKEVTTTKPKEKFMKEQILDVSEFQLKFNSDYNTEPTLIDSYQLRYKLLKEENEEYLEAAQNNDLVEVADALGDQLYIVLGNIISHGMQGIIGDVFNEIHQSNMSKLDKNEEPIINGVNGFDDTRPIGKILKSENYFKPNLKQFLNV